MSIKDRLSDGIFGIVKEIESNKLKYFVYCGGSLIYQEGDFDEIEDFDDNGVICDSQYNVAIITLIQACSFKDARNKFEAAKEIFFTSNY